MEKLIELLNEYEPYIQSDGTHTDNFWWYVSQGHSAVFPKEVGVERIISKSYGFIQWLIENDKIEFKKLLDDHNFCEIRALNRGIVSCLLMLLTISDTPIDFLCSLLK